MFDHEVAVIGLGAMGSAVLYQLAKAGVDVLGIDRFAPPHAQGSSHGDTRITRMAVGEGEDYVPFVVRSHAIWKELEAATGTSLLTECGALIVAPGGLKSSHHGKPDFLARTFAAAERFTIPHERLEAGQIRARFPHLSGITDDAVAYFEPGGGFVRPELCIETQLVEARRHGAHLKTDTTVLAIEAIDGGVRIETDGGAIRARRVVVCAGAWNAALLGAPFDDLLSVNRQVLHWFELERPEDASEPVIIWMHGAGDSDYFYGFPPLPGEGAQKFATETYRETTTADAIDRQVLPAESAEFFRTHIAQRVAGVSPRVVKAAACLYTMTPDRGFVLDWHPRMKNVFVVSACSGHGFKHSAGIGETVAREVTRGGEAELRPFTVSRFGR
ncbi:N-methyl-L-tryptophan oxidase [Aureimonas altamirensis]|uniref:N-methyl-L-tryptophan oxidase n=1 Tax=Aureimonas altamirensis TaxID=370622 RepID=UPI001E596A81|nr:N-methyl-L-tryptophan oxidase [Aureimonas altamirensis]UHD45285.1 N-methyl-L-tryptophan oxidase [Aureimonas altamirensis]